VKVLPNLVQQFLAAALVVLGAAIFTAAQSKTERTAAPQRVWHPSRDARPGTPLCRAGDPAAQGSDLKTPTGVKRNPRPEELSPANSPLQSRRDPEPVKYSYEFSQPQFYVRHIVIEHDANGRGKISFERLDEDTTIIEPVELSPTALSRIAALWQGMRFLDSQENYQSDKQFPHLGTMRLKMEQGTRERTATFNWTNDHDASALVNEYRRVADQAIFVFDISVARENQPLNAPKLMELLESLLKRDGLSDPHQLIPLLKDLSTDEHLPLIARNHALRLLKKIEK
jgi:hypothetical protein